jgi:hypothetical protein
MRWWARLRAFWGGYFWLPCPICGRYFGGHDVADIHLMDTLSSGRCVCRKCEDRAWRLNQVRFPGIF